MTAVTPTIQVLLDNGTGAFATDVTSRVSLSAGVTVSGHGRTDEFSTAAATTLTLTLRNDDAGLSTGLGFGLGPFGLGTFGGTGIPVYPGQWIRYKETLDATTVTAFTGRISEMPLAWEGGPAKASHITLTAVDPLADLANRPLRSMLEEENLLTLPYMYYALGEAPGSTSAGDTSGSQAVPLTFTGTGAAPTFGAGTGPVGADGSTAATFAGGRFLANGLSDSIPAPLSGSLGVWFTTSTTPSTFPATLVLARGWFIQVDTTGRINAAGPGFSGLTGGPSVVDGHLHYAALTSESGGGISLYVDGVFVGGALTSATTVTSTVNVGALFTGSISHVCGTPRRITPLFQYQVGVGALTETTAARFSRIASYAGATTSTPANSGVLMASQATSGSSALDALQAVAAAEGGVMFADGSGTLVLQGHGYRPQKTTATLTVPLKDLTAPTVALTWDTQQLYNQVTATRTGGAAQVVNDTGSISTYGTHATSLDLGLLNDSDVLSAAQWLVNKHSQPVQRMPSVTVNLLTSSIAASLMQTEIGDRWALSGLPSQAWTGFGDLTVEGWSKTLSVSSSSSEWSMTANLLPFVLSQAAVWDDAGSLWDTAVWA